MRKSATLIAFMVLGAAMMYGQATRTWVSGVGDDANPCSRTAPCKTFAGAISKTAPGGEINALDPGGFGALTITKSITLDGGGGQVASVLVAGTNGIVVAAGPNDVVTIRNMRLDGLLGAGNGNAGLSGIRFISGKNLSIENCVIFGFNTNGIDIALGASASVNILNTTVWNLNQSAAAGSGVGIRAATTSGVVNVGIEHSTISLVTTGIEAAQNAHVRVTDSVIQHASGSGLLADDSTSNNGKIDVDNSSIVFNGTGATSSGGSINSVSVAYSSVAYNTGAAFAATAPSANFSYANTNRLSNNGGGNGTFTSVPLLP